MTQVLLADEEAELARSICPPEVLKGPDFSGDRLLKPRPGMYLRVELMGGVVVRSPLHGITGRRWWTVVRTAAERGKAIETPPGLADFLRLEQQLGLGDLLVHCDVCGDDTTPRGLKTHRRSNSACRFLSNVAEVRTFWDLGYRDPYRLHGDVVPITWTELNSRVAWRNRLHVIRFRLWTAVLISTAQPT